MWLMVVKKFLTIHREAYGNELGMFLFLHVHHTHIIILQCVLRADSGVESYA